jgi:hypothetical protein
MQAVQGLYRLGVGCVGCFTGRKSDLSVGNITGSLDR